MGNKALFKGTSNEDFFAVDLGTMDCAGTGADYFQYG